MRAAAIEGLIPDLQAPGATLARIQRLVDYLFCEPLTVARVFGSKRLDDACQEIGRANLAKLGLAAPAVVDEGLAVYVASRLQASGGHTAALVDVIRLSPKRRSVVIVTDTCGRTRRAEVQQRLGGLPGVEVEYAPRGGHLAKLDWLQQRLHALAPATVWLFNHHEDSVAVAAVQPDQGYRLNFYHHGDDRLSLGVCLGWGAHYDPLPLPWHNCREVVHVADNLYLPLVAADQGVRPHAAAATPSGLVTCTAAGFNKVEVDYFVQYVDVVPQLLRVTGGRHVHIGRLSPMALRHIRRRLRALGVPQEAFVYIPYVPSVWRALQEHGVDLYLASFPYGGGRTLVEVMGAGVPAVMHRHVLSRMIGGLDSAYDGVPTWREPEELYAFLRGVDPAFLEAQGRLARAWYEQYHRDALVEEALRDPERRIPVPALKPGYAPDALLQAWTTAREVSVPGLLRRRLWRGFRRAKAWAGRTW